MTSTKTLLAIALVVGSAACSKGNSRPADSALNTDLSLAAQQRGYTPLDSISAAERAKTTALAAAPVSRTPVATHTARRASSSERSSGSSNAGTSAGTVERAPTTVTEKHTQRDAAIGAAAGAIIGATTSRNKVKGGVIGAAVGGILGGVLGNNVDKTKKSVP